MYITYTKHIHFIPFYTKFLLDCYYYKELGIRISTENTKEITLQVSLDWTEFARRDLVGYISLHSAAIWIQEGAVKSKSWHSRCSNELRPRKAVVSA